MASERHTSWMGQVDHVWTDAGTGADWNVRVGFAQVRGRSVPVRLELVPLSLAGEDFDQVEGVVVEHDAPTLTRGVVDRLPVGHFVERTREGLIAAHADHDPECCDVAASLAPVRSDAADHDARLRQVADLYRAKVEQQDPKPLLSVWNDLSRDEVKARGGKPLTYARVRKWVTEARQRDYLPRIDRKEGK